MTVAELIGKLQTMPQDYVVKVADWNEQYARPHGLSDLPDIEYRDDKRAVYIAGQAAEDNED